MPKQTSRRQTNRPAPYKPYNLRGSAANMTAVMQSPMGWGHPPQHNYPWTDPSFSAYQPMQQSLPPSYVPMPAPAQQQTQPKPSQSVPWTSDEDNRLVDAKSQGLGWKEIQTKYFPSKSDNACRKRHERLMQKWRTTDWDEARVRRVTQAYTDSSTREKFWKEIAKRVGEERWEDVERVCFQQGLKNLRSDKTGQSRSRSRASSGNVEYETPSAGDESYEHDDSGYIEGLAGPSSRRSSHGQSQGHGHSNGHAHGHSHSISLPVTGASTLSTLDLIAGHHPHHHHHQTQQPSTPQHVTQQMPMFR